MVELAKQEARNDLIEQYREYAQNIVGWMIKTMHLPRDSFDEFLSAGYLGLVEAASRFKPETGHNFRAYAYFRIRGAVIDSIRSSSQLSGKAYSIAKAMQAAYELRGQLLAEQEIRAENKILEHRTDSLSQILDYAATSVLAYRLSFADAEEELGALTDEEPDPEMRMLLQESYALIKELAETLPEKERTIIREFYFQDKTFGEIIRDNDGMGKTWVSRLHTRALRNLKARYLQKMAQDS